MPQADAVPGVSAIYDGALDEAALRFANGDDAGAEARDGTDDDDVLALLAPSTPVGPTTTIDKDRSAGTPAPAPPRPARAPTHRGPRF